MITAPPRLAGYRDTDRPALTGRWLPGELLGLPLVEAPAMAEPVTIAPPDGRLDERVYLARGRAVVRFTELDWVHRRARLEIGVHTADPDALTELVTLAVRHGFGVLDLRRLHGWVTPAAYPCTDAVAAAGFVREGVVPDAIWHDGRPVPRELWGVVRDA